MTIDGIERNIGYLELAMAQVIAISRETPTDTRAERTYRLLAEIWTWLQEQRAGG